MVLYVLPWKFTKEKENKKNTKYSQEKGAIKKKRILGM